MRGRIALGKALWLAGYLALATAPLGIVFLVGNRPAGRSFWTEFSVALGFVGLAMMTLQFALTARFEWLKAPYGSDVVYAFHKHISVACILMVLAHPAILFVERWPEMRTRPVTHFAAFWAGTASLLCLVLLAGVSLFRQRLGVEYDRWRRWHAILAIAAVMLGVFHALRVGYYLDAPVKRAAWTGYTLLFAVLVMYVRLVKPWRQTRRPYEIERVTPQRGDAWTLAVRPVGHPGLRFKPGQFTWITVRDSPFGDHEHPFSFSGSAEAAPRLEFTIKNLGDWTSRVKEFRPGETVYVDGAFGALTIDRHPHKPGFCFVAGGIGITPMISALRTMADRGDRRPAVLIYAVRDLEAATFREDLDALAGKMANLKLVYVLQSPPPDWDGESGFVTADLLRRHLPPGGGGYECFICGPLPMMEAVERALHAIGVPLGDFHSERFNLV